MDITTIPVGELRSTLELAMRKVIPDRVGPAKAAACEKLRETLSSEWTDAMREVFLGAMTREFALRVDTNTEAGLMTILIVATLEEVNLRGRGCVSTIEEIIRILKPNATYRFTNHGRKHSA